MVDAQGKEIKDDPAALWPFVPYETKEEIFPALFERDFLSAPSALIRMDCFRRVGLFDTSLKTAQDYDIWMRILKYYDLMLIKRALLKYRWHGANLTYQATPATEQERGEVLLKAYKNLTIEDIFPSLRQKRDVMAYGEAYEKLATYLEKSGIPALISVSRIYKNKADSLLSSKAKSAEFKEEGMKGEFELVPSGFHDRKIKLLIEAPSLDKGGMEEVVYHIVTHLDPDLFRPVVVCIEKGGYMADRLKREGIPVEILGKTKEEEYTEILRRYQIDIVNSHFSLFGPTIAHRHGIPTASVLHNIYSWYSASLLDEFRMADLSISKYIAVSNQVASFFKYRFNIDESRMSVIPDGVNEERFSKVEIPEKRNLIVPGIDEEDFVFLHVGAVTPAKMHNLLVAAMREIVQIQPRIKLISAGPVLDPEYSLFIQRKVEEFHLGQQIKLIGFVEDPSPYYRLANAFLLPSLIEGWGIVTLEAMYHGLPLILTKVGGAEELIEDRDVGILIENCCEDLFHLVGSDLDHYSHLDFPKNTPDLIDAMLNIYRNQEEWKEKAKRGREKVISRYTWDKIISQYEKEFIVLGLKGEKEKSLRLEATVRDQEERLDEKDRRLNELDRKLDEQTREMSQRLIAISSEFQQQFGAIRYQLDYVLLRLSIKERIKERLFKSLKAIHKFVPKKLREKYRFQYRRFFFDRIFQDKERFESPLPPVPRRPHFPVEEEIETFLNSAQKNNPRRLMVLYAADPYIESRGQRSTWLAKEFAHRGIPVVIFYWRWDPKEEIVRSLNPLILSIPIDMFGKVERHLLSISSDPLKKVFLIEFPDAFLFEKINVMNTHAFITVYDCIDDWEQFAKAGQAVWYDPDVERYLIHNTNLAIATHPSLAEKLKGMGADLVSVIPNGVDTESLDQQARKSIDLERGNLTIGYFGYLTESWFDWDLVLRTASRKKDWVFHLIGYGEPSGLKLPENVRFWGKVEHQDLPSYTRFWDVAIIPFREGRLTDAVDPIKLYEYLYLGLPVVATNMPHLQGKPGVFPCASSDFEKTLASAKQSVFPKKEVEAFVQSNTWKQRVDRILEEVDRIDPSQDILKHIG